MPSSKDSALKIIVDCENNISDTRERYIIVRHKRTGVVSQAIAYFVTDGRDGLIEATFNNDQLPEAGQYDAQAKIVTIQNTVYYGEIANFSLYNTIEEV
jgi:hypothetical protein